jgi:DNA-3-methyladenine glycosylase II
MLLRPREPFSLSHTLRFILSPPQLLNGRKVKPILDYFEDGEYLRVLQLDGEPTLYGVSQERSVRGAALRLRIRAGINDERTHTVLHAWVARQFAVDLDIAPFYRLAGKDPVLSKLTRHFNGMRIPQSPNAFESLVCAILEQQINLSFAHQVKKALVEEYGSHVEFNGRRYNSFPEPSALAILTPRDLRRIQISGPKARYIIELSRAVLDGSLDLDALHVLQPEAAHEKLLSLKGVGPWTAQYVGLRALGHLDSLPAGDVGLQKAMQRFYGLRKVPTPAQVERIARAWSGWRSYAAFYLWLTYWESREWIAHFASTMKQQRRRVR